MNRKNGFVANQDVQEGLKNQWYQETQNTDSLQQICVWVTIHWDKQRTL